MDISIIIVSWNVRDLLKKCLESIFAYTKENTPARGVLSVVVDQFGKPSLPDTSKDSIACQNNLSRVIADNQKQSHWNGRDLNPQHVSGKKRSLPIEPTAPLLGTAFDIISQFEVIVVDNASLDGTIEMVQQNFPQVRLIANQKNKGFAYANNQGIKESKGEYILLLNPDTEFIENSLEKIIAKMKSDNKIGVLGCRILNPDKSIQPSVRRFPTVWSQLVILFKLHKLFPELLDYYLMKDFVYSTPPLKQVQGRLLPLLGEEGIKTTEVDQVMGAFFCVNKELFDKIGLLDEGYFIWFEEVDFCRRTKEAGYEVVYWPNTSIIHHGGQSFSQQMTLQKQLWFFKSALRYFTKSR